MSDNEKQKKKRRIKLRYFLLVDLIIVCALGWFFLSTPRWYKPIKPMETEEVSPYLVHNLAPSFYNNIQFSEPFTLHITEDGIKDIIARQSWPLEYEGFELSEPLVEFQDGSAILGIRFKTIGLSTTISAKFKATVLKDKKMQILVEKVQLGKFPSTKLVKYIFGKMTPQINAIEKTKDVGPFIAGILTGKPFEPHVTYNERKIEILDLQIEDGQITVKLQKK